MPARYVRSPRADRMTILGGLGLATATLLVLGVLLALAWLQGAARSWPVAGWVALAGLAAVLLSLELLFLRDYLRVRRAAQVAAGPRRR
jgi:hypothetical protein